MIGSRLREARMARGLTQQAMANLLGVGLRTYQKYEEGSRNPPLDTLANMSKVLGVTTDWLLGLSDEAPSGAR